ERADISVGDRGTREPRRLAEHHVILDRAARADGRTRVNDDIRAELRRVADAHRLTEQQSRRARVGAQLVRACSRAPAVARAHSRTTLATPEERVTPRRSTSS